MGLQRAAIQVVQLRTGSFQPSCTLKKSVEQFRFNWEGRNEYFLKALYFSLENSQNDESLI